MISQLGREPGEKLPPYFVFSRQEKGSYCLEALASWLSRHARSKRKNKPAIYSLSTVSSLGGDPIRDNGVNGHGI